jgi:thiol-disulfide isomerase/thioredoxin
MRILEVSIAWLEVRVKNASLLSVAVLSAAIVFAQSKPEPAKTDPSKPVATKPPDPPEVTAYREAKKIETVEQRLAAMREVIARYGKTYSATDARHNILETILAKSPGDKQAVLKAAADFIQGMSKDSRRYGRNTVATLLLDKNVYLPEAEAYARKALDEYKQNKFYSEQRKSAAKAKQPLPSDADLAAGFNQARSGPLETVGLIALAQGRDAEARKLLEQTFSYDNGRGRAAAALAELYEKDGDEKVALEHLYLAQLSGRMPKEGRARLERLHKKRHNDSLTDLEAVLDKVYREKFPAPIHVNAYAPASGRTDRTVLAEVFTGSGCPPCAAADLAFDVVLEQYKRSDVIVLMYHQHIPRPDPMAHPSSEERFKWYVRGGVPTYVIDGKVDGGGGPRRDTPRLYKKINELVEKRLVVAPQAKIRLQAKLGERLVHVRIAAENNAEEPKQAKLHLVLAERELRYSGENGIRFHPMAVRDSKEFDIDLAKAGEHSHTFDIAGISRNLKAHLDDYEVNGRHGKITFSEKKHEINPTELVVVAFVQDPSSKEILQSAYLDLNGVAVISNR